MSDDEAAHIHVDITGGRLAVTDPAVLAEISGQLQAIYQEFAAVLAPMALGSLDAEVPRALSFLSEAEFPATTDLLRALTRMIVGSKAVVAR